MDNDGEIIYIPKKKIIIREEETINIKEPSKLSKMPFSISLFLLLSIFGIIGTAGSSTLFGWILNIVVFIVLLIGIQNRKKWVPTVYLIIGLLFNVIGLTLLNYNILFFIILCIYPTIFWWILLRRSIGKYLIN